MFNNDDIKGGRNISYVRTIYANRTYANRTYEGESLSIEYVSRNILNCYARCQDYSTWYAEVSGCLLYFLDDKSDDNYHDLWEALELAYEDLEFEFENQDEEQEMPIALSELALFLKQDIRKGRHVNY